MSLTHSVNGIVVEMTPEEEALFVATQSRLLSSRPSVTEIKAECRRRILLIMDEDQQRNALAAGQAATMQFGADPTRWPSELQARQAAAMAAWTEIERLRARSNEIEKLEILPGSISADRLWED